MASYSLWFDAVHRSSRSASICFIGDEPIPCPYMDTRPAKTMTECPRSTGMAKSSAAALLHWPQIADFFSRRQFIVTSWEGGGGRGRTTRRGAVRKPGRDRDRRSMPRSLLCIALALPLGAAFSVPGASGPPTRALFFPCVAALWFLLTELVSCRMGSLDEAYSWRTATRPRRRFAEKGACPRPAALRAALARLRRASGQCGRHRSSFHGGERAAGADTG